MELKMVSESKKTPKRKSVTVAEHKRRKPAPAGAKYNRSKLLKLIMPLISGGNGDRLIEALNKRDPDAVKTVMLEVTRKVMAEAVDKHKVAREKAEK